MAKKEEKQQAQEENPFPMVAEFNPTTGKFLKVPVKVGVSVPCWTAPPVGVRLVGAFGAVFVL